DISTLLAQPDEPAVGPGDLGVAIPAGLREDQHPNRSLGRLRSGLVVAEAGRDRRQEGQGGEEEGRTREAASRLHGMLVGRGWGSVPFGEIGRPDDLLKRSNWPTIV